MLYTADMEELLMSKPLKVELTPEQWGILYNTLRDVSYGYKINRRGEKQRISRTEIISLCRDAMTALGYRWDGSFNE